MRMTAPGNRVSFWSDEKVLKLIVVVVVQLREHTKNYHIAHFK